jgi:hypothetical protein
LLACCKSAGTESAVEFTQLRKKIEKYSRVEGIPMESIELLSYETFDGVVGLFLFEVISKRSDNFG